MPGARDGATVWTDPTGKFWLFGGEGFDSADTIGELNDLWEFDPNTGTWEWVSGSNSVGSVRYYGQPGSYGTRGTPSIANYPGGRQGSNSWTDATGNLWLFGGNGFGAIGGISDWGNLDDLWRFNPSTDEWTWMTGTPSIASLPSYGTFGIPDPGNDPGSRGGAVSWADLAGNFWLFAGVAPGNGIYEDSWEYLLNGPAHATPPTYSPAGGSYIGPQSTTISDALSGTAIYYTTDGSMPTTSSTAYTSAIHIGHSQTINAIAVAAGYGQSPVNSATFDITPAQPTINWPPPASITYGTPLSSTQLDATTTSPGTLTYTPPAGTVLSGGTHTLSVSFTPEPDSGYAAASFIVGLTVLKAVPVITWPVPAAMT